MNGRFFLGSLLGGVGLFLGGFLFWAVLPLSFYVMNAMPQEKTVISTLQTHLPQSGVYLYPMPQESQGKQAEQIFVAKHKTGPLVMMFYRKQGLDPMQAPVFLMGFGQHLLSAIFMALLLLLALPQLSTFEKRYFFIVLAGVFASVWVDLSAPIWFHQPWDYHLFNTFSRIGSWVIAAIPMAWLIQPKTTDAASPQISATT